MSGPNDHHFDPLTGGLKPGLGSDEPLSLPETAASLKVLREKSQELNKEKLALAADRAAFEAEKAAHEAGREEARELAATGGRRK